MIRIIRERGKKMGKGNMENGAKGKREKIDVWNMGKEEFMKRKSGEIGKKGDKGKEGKSFLAHPPPTLLALVKVNEI